MSFTSAPPPSAAHEQRSDIAFGIRDADRLIDAVKLRERRLKK